jgi:hypothetical protein
MEEEHIALPTLYGAPAYARPTPVVQTLERPFDPDELPIEADQTDEERDFASTLPARAFAPGGVTLRRNVAWRSDESGEPRRPAASLRGIADRILGGG